MRNTTAQQDTDLQALAYDIHTRVEVQNADGTWIDLTDDPEDNLDWLVTATISEDVDRPVIQGKFNFVRDREGGNSLSPTREDSALNEDDLGAYAPLLDVGRGIRTNVAVVAAGVAPVAGDYQEIFLGTIDQVNWGQDPIRVSARDQIGALLADSFVEDRRTYGTSAGRDMELVIQDILDDWAPSVTLLTPVSPSFVITTGTWDGISVLQAVTRIAAKIGWVCRVRWDDGGSNWRLVLEEPDRSATVPDWTFGAEDYFDVTNLAINGLQIRNAVDVYYYDSDQREVVSATDATSISRFGRKFMRIAEDPESPISTSTEAQTLADAVVADLKDPDADQVVDGRLFWPVQIRDLLRYTANGSQYNVDQDLAVYGYRHELAKGSGATHISVRGKPAGLYRYWKQIGVTDEPTDADVTETRYSSKEPSFAIIRTTDGGGSPGYSVDIHFDLGPDADGFYVTAGYFDGSAFGWGYGRAAVGSGVHRVRDTFDTGDQVFLDSYTLENVTFTPKTITPPASVAASTDPGGKTSRWDAGDVAGDSGEVGIRIDDGSEFVGPKLLVDSADFEVVPVGGVPELRLLNPPGATELDDLSDVTITGAAEGDVLYRNATEWVNQGTLTIADIGSAGAPSYSFLSQATTGMYLAALGELAFTVDAEQVAEFRRTGASHGLFFVNTATGDNFLDWGGTGISLARKITDQGGLGVGADSSIVIQAGDNLDATITGLGIVAGTTDEVLHLVSDGRVQILPNQQSGFTQAARWRFETTGQLLPDYDGTAGAPVYSFGSEVTMGMFRSGSGQLGFSVGGTERVRMYTGRVNVNTVLVVGSISTDPPNLTAGDVLLSGGVLAFNNAPSGNVDHIWYGDADNVFHFTADVARLTDGNARIRVGVGTVALPSVMVGEEDTGWSRPAAGILAASTSGREHFRIDTQSAGHGRATFQDCQVGVAEGAEITRSTAGSVTLDWDAYQQVPLRNDGNIDTIDIDDSSMVNGFHYELIVYMTTGGQASITFTAAGVLQWQNDAPPEFPLTVGDRTAITFIRTMGRTLGYYADAPV